MQLWMWIAIGGPLVFMAFGIMFSQKPEMQEKVQKAVKVTKKKSQDTVFDESMLASMKETAEDFLEFDDIQDGMISFTKDPNYFTMAFGVNGINISMYSTQERAALKNGFMSILNTLKDETQFLVQSRYVNLSKNFEIYKPVIQAAEKEIDYLKERAQTEQSEVIRKKLVEKSQKLAQRNNYANHIIDFFNFYTRESDCIYIKIFVIVSYRHVPKGRFEKREKIREEAYSTLANKVKIYREQFDSLKLKTYGLDNVQTANIIYSTLLKNESSYANLGDAVKNGLLDLTVENLPGENYDKRNIEKYKDDYDYDYADEVAAGDED